MAGFIFVNVGQSDSKRTPVVHHVVGVKSQTELRLLAGYRNVITSHRLQTWNCQDDLGIKRSRASVSVWALPMSLGYRAWAADRWKTRAVKCVAALQLRTIPSTGDWSRAVELVQRIYPGTSGWLLSCSSGEGGHGRFVLNHQGSGAGGWMQFLSSTFYSHYRAAFADARAKGFVIDRVHESWYDPIGQAVTAAHMRTHGQSSHWDARIDYLCR